MQVRYRLGESDNRYDMTMLNTATTPANLRGQLSNRPTHYTREVMSDPSILIGKTASLTAE